MSSLSLQKKFSAFLLLTLLVGCQNLRTREELRKPTVPSARPEVSAPVLPPGEELAEEEEPAMPVPIPPPAPVIPALPKIGIILGAGGAKAYAHIGFLHELQRAKVPLHAIGGVEFAAPMAALYASKELANDVEWQMFKLKDEDIIQKSLLGGVNTNKDVTGMKDFFSLIFSSARAEDFRVPFACPSYNLGKNQVYLMNRGGLQQMMYLCTAYPPLFKPYQNSVSGVRDITSLANYLRQKGANHIVFVNVLEAPGRTKSYTPDPNSTENVLWGEIAGLYNKPLPGVDTVISLDTTSYGIMNFDKRREIMNRGAQSAARQLKGLTRKWGL